MKKLQDKMVITVVALRVLAAVGSAAALGSVAGCNTVEGAGQDIEAAGDAIADTAEDAKN